MKPYHHLNQTPLHDDVLGEWRYITTCCNKRNLFQFRTNSQYFLLDENYRTAHAPRMCIFTNRKPQIQAAYPRYTIFE